MSDAEHAADRGTDGPADSTADGTADGGWLGWRAAAELALYGTGTGTATAGAPVLPATAGAPPGFFLREAPAAHFRTAVHASRLFAAAVARLLLRVDAALGHPAELSLVDIGAGRGELLAEVLAAVSELEPATAARLRARAVERAPRPPGLDERIEWTGQPPTGVRGLLFANEWLDNIPLEVAETGPAGEARYVQVAADGRERLGGPVAGADAAWLRRWWPLSGVPGRRAEIGRSRDAAWAAAVAGVERGVAVAVDYAHTRETRPPLGTLTAYRDGRQVSPVPDGSCDLTAHVAVDALAAAGAEAAGAPALLLEQRGALHQLGVSGRRPPLELAHRDPAGYLRALSWAGEAAELTDPAGFGGFAWLVQPVGVEPPLHA